MPDVIEREGWITARSVTIDFASAINATSYRLAIAIPLAEPPAGGFPVFLVLDGQANFGTASETARSQSMFNPQISPALVVGVGYQASSVQEVLHLRYRDFTTAAPPEHMNRHDPYFGAVNGGVDLFLRVVLDEVLPIVAARFAVNYDRCSLFGHSLGGLACLRMMLTKPAAFDAFIASSPSLHWNHRAVSVDIARCKALLANVDRTPRVLLSSASEESAIHPVAENARALAEQLSAIKSLIPFKVSFHIFEGENHDSVVPAALSRAVRFALAVSAGAVG